jgi:NADPH2:quinone reductase
MRAWQLHDFGSLDHLRLDEVPRPEPGPGEVLLQVAYAALNPADRYMALGQYPRPAAPPFALGRDASGTVVRAAESGRIPEGSRVVLLRSDLGVSRTGTLAEYVSVPEDCLAPLPEGWSLAEGAAGPLVLLTAWKALVEQGDVRPGETVLVNGASGGVGTAAVMLGSALGARVVALSRDAAKREALAALGAAAVVDASDPAWGEAVKSAVGGGRVDLVIENLGGSYFEQNMKLVSYGGRVMIVGLLAGLAPKLPLGLMIHKGIRVQGLSVSGYSNAEAQAAWDAIVALLAQAGRRPLVDAVFPMDALPAAFDRLAAGPLGKVAIAVGTGL